MITLSSAILAVLLITSAITAVSILNIFAHSIGHETQLHDLRNHVKELHYQHALYLAQIKGQIPDKKSQSQSEPESPEPLSSAPAGESVENLSIEPETPPTAAAA